MGNYVFGLDKDSPVLLSLFNFTSRLFVVKKILWFYCGHGSLIEMVAHIVVPLSGSEHVVKSLKVYLVGLCSLLLEPSSEWRE